MKVSKHIFSFDSFITCERNMIAFNAAKAVAALPMDAREAPL